MSPLSFRSALVAAALLALGACGDEDHPQPPEEPAQTEELSALGLFDDEVAQTPADGVLAYDVNAVLFADESEKLRFIALPPGSSAQYEPREWWDYPDGTRFVKTFFYYTDARDPELGRKLLETRIIELDGGKWTGRTYVWNEAQTGAWRHKVGKSITVEWIDATGEAREQEYRVPNDNECKTCHSKSHEFEPLGPRTRQLNREHEYDGKSVNQIDHLEQLGWLEGDVEDPAQRFTLADPYGDADLDERAHAYLDANCSHCHRPGGEAGATSLDLRAEITEPHSFGVCRRPVSAGPGSAGRRFDIVPGDPDASLMVFRMESTDPKIKMPELPTLTSDKQGSALIRAWIASMPKEPGCN